MNKKEKKIEKYKCLKMCEVVITFNDSECD